MATWKDKVMQNGKSTTDKNYFIWTVGCQMNVADSNYVAAALQGRGYSEVEDIDAADVVVLNSCVVRQSAEDRFVGKLGEVALV